MLALTLVSSLLKLQVHLFGKKFLKIIGNLIYQYNIKKKKLYVLVWLRVAIKGLDELKCFIVFNYILLHFVLLH